MLNSKLYEIKTGNYKVSTMIKKMFRYMLGIMLSGLLLFYCSMVFAGNIDPDNDGSRFTYGENIGWINANPSNSGTAGIEVTTSKLTGYIWAENIGWISLSCENSSSCATINYGVINDGNGNLSGYAWSENTGWISFSCDNNASCLTVNYGITIDLVTGEFSGHAWGENIGWVKFNHSEAVYRVKTGLRGSDDDGVLDADGPFLNDSSETADSDVDNESQAGSGESSSGSGSGLCFIGALMD